jgi:hypothetical protein
MRKSTIIKLSQLLSCLLFVCTCSMLNGQNLDWVKTFGSNVTVSKTAVDTSGNIYLTGYFSNGPVDFDPGPAVANLTATGYDPFLLKLNASGAFVWVKHFQGGHADGGAEPSGISIDTLNNIYLTGSFGSFLDNDPYSIDFDPGAGVFNLTSTGADFINYYIDRDIFVVKLNSLGGLLWARKIAGVGDEKSSSITTDADGNVVVTGSFEATVDFNPGPGNNNLTASNNYDADLFTCKLSHDGNYVWAKHLGAANSAVRPLSIKTDRHNNIYTMGVFRDTVDFDPGAGIQQLTTAVSAQGWDVINIFISKLDANGNHLWAKNMGNVPPGGAVTDFIQPMAMTLDASGNILISGAFTDTSDVDPGPGTSYLYSNGETDAFIIKLDTTGNFKWAKSFGGDNYEIGWDLTTDDYDNVYSLGRYRGLVDFDPSDTGSHILTSLTSQGGLFLSKFDSSGNFNWVSRFDVMANGSVGLNGMGLALNPVDRSIYVASNFSGTVDFDPGSDTLAMTTPDGNPFVLRLNNCMAITSSVAITACDSFTLNGTTYTQSGSYEQSYAVAGGCDSVVTLNLTINPAPVAVITRSGNTLNAVNSGATYQWVDCNNASLAIPGAFQQSFSPSQNGRYAVVVDLNGCRDTSDCVLINGITGIGAYDSDQDEVMLYPNPTQGTITITAKTPLHNATVSVRNVLGQLIEERTKQVGAAVLVDLKYLTTGVYFVEVTEGQKSRKFKVVKQ